MISAAAPREIAWLTVAKRSLCHVDQNSHRMAGRLAAMSIWKKHQSSPQQFGGLGHDSPPGARPGGVLDQRLCC